MAGELARESAPTLLVHRLAERLAFERSGSHLYEALMLRLDRAGSAAAPSREELERLRKEKLAHMKMAAETLEQLGADPAANTPGTDLVGVQVAGLMKAMTEPGASFARSLHALLVAELADNDGWWMLVELARALGRDELAGRFQQAWTEEQQHLGSVRRWMKSAAS